MLILRDIMRARDTDVCLCHVRVNKIIQTTAKIIEKNVISSLFIWKSCVAQTFSFN